MKAKTALITGGSSGIGFELAKLFADDGYQIVLVARGKEELDKAAAELRATHDVDVVTIPADLADPGSSKQLVEELTKQKITIDVLVNNAGFGLLGAFSDADEAKTIGMIQLNIAALTELSKRLLPGMLQRKRGRILNVASTAAFQPGPFMAVYYATKAYVLSFSEALHEELRDTGVTVTTLAPGPTATSFQIRAQIDAVPLFRSGLMDAASVAKIGYAALNRGQRLVIPGLRNSLGAFLIRLAPRRLVLRFVRSLQT